MELRAAIKRIPFAQPTWALLRLLRGRNARFEADYHRNSGAGSDLEATHEIVRALPDVIKTLSTRSMLDIPCGDFLWMSQVDLSAIQYTGADVIESLILSHQKMHGSVRRTFKRLDIITSELPEVDLIFCRDCLVHFSERLVKKAVNNIKASRSQYLLTTTFPAHSTNIPIVTGSWRPLNLCAPPFNLPAPIRLLSERHPAPFEDKSLGLWQIRDLPTF